MMMAVSGSCHRLATGCMAGDTYVNGILVLKQRGRRLAYKTFEEADAYMRDFIERDKQNIAKPAEFYSKFPTATKIHDYTRD